MAEAKRDNNYIPTLLGIKNTDGRTPVNIKADPTSHSLQVATDYTGSLGMTAVDETTHKGGVLRVIDSATGDIERTTSGWIENNEALGWYISRTSTAVSAQINNSVLYEGHKTLRLETTDVTGRLATSNIKVISPTTVSADDFKYLIPLKPSTVYKISCYVKTNNVVADAVFFDFPTYDVNKTTRTTQTSNKLTGTSDVNVNGGFVELSVQFTTAADRAWGAINFRNSIAGNIGYADFAPYSLKLEEVTTITNPSSLPANLYPKVTPVTSKDNIDQSLDAGGAYTNTYAIPTSINEGATHRQTFTPTKKKQQGIAVWPIQNGTGDWTLTVHDASNNEVASKTIANASVVEGALLSFLNAFDWTTGAYHFHITSTVNDGTVKANTSNDLETASFTTLYSKNTTNFTVRLDGQDPMSVTAPTTDGWEDGTVIDTAILGIPPLVLAPGDNTVYVSSNGPAIADGTVDGSMQVKLAGNIFDNSGDRINAAKDENGYPTLMAVSSEDGSTPVAVYCDANGGIFVAANE